MSNYHKLQEKITFRTFSFYKIAFKSIKLKVSINKIKFLIPIKLNINLKLIIIDNIARMIIRNLTTISTTKIINSMV